MTKPLGVILGVAGSIAAYKAAEIVRRLVEEGARVQVAMTPAATRFVGPLTFEALSGRPVYLDPVSIAPSFGSGGTGIAHTDMTSEADVLLVAPASADILGKITHGLGDDPVSVCALALSPGAPLVLAPAMNPRMWNAESVKANMRILESRRAVIVGPAHGEVACGEVGTGRMSEPAEIVAATLRAVALARRRTPPKRVLILTGPTREHIDDVRFISNGSSGLMGLSLAEAAHESGDDVTVITGPAALRPPAWIRSRSVTSAEEMLEAARTIEFDIVVAPAAVADFRPSTRAAGKSAKELISSIDLVPTPDVLATLVREGRERGAKFRSVAFAAEESGSDVESALEKGGRKGVDVVILNEARATMGAENASVTMLDVATRSAARLEEAPKKRIARRIWESLSES